MRFILIFIQLLIVSESFAQKITFSGTSEPLQDDRYDGIEGTPYLFEDWKNARVMNEDLKFIEDVKVNYNGYTQEFEATDGTNFIQLDERSHQRVEVWDENSNDYLIFIKSRDYGLRSTYVRLHYSSNTIEWISSFIVKIDDRKLETPGKTEVIKKFIDKTTNYFVFGSTVVEFKKKKKKVIEALNIFPETSQVISKNKLDVSKDQDLIKLLEILNGSG